MVYVWHIRLTADGRAAARGQRQARLRLCAFQGREFGVREKERAKKRERECFDRLVLTSESLHEILNLLFSLEIVNRNLTILWGS